MDGLVGLRVRMVCYDSWCEWLGRTGAVDGLVGLRDAGVDGLVDLKVWIVW